METKKCNFDAVKVQLEALTTTEKKINYLIDQIAERKLHLTQKKSLSGFKTQQNIFNDEFIQCCEIELSRVKQTTDLISNTNSTFKISDKKGAKTNLIRILNALYELMYLKNIDGTFPTKQEFFDSFGIFFNTDFSSYHTILSQSLKEQSIEVNVKVFNQMIDIIQNTHYSNH